MFTQPYLADPSLWVAVAFFGFVAALIYMKVPSKMTTALDKRGDEIQSELREAKKLREDAQALLADYQRKKTEAENEAQNIIVAAKREAEILALETEEKLKESLERRTRQAEEKIARAEVQALSEVQNTAAEMSIKAAENILRGSMSGGRADPLIEDAIKAIPGNFS